jgi:hypothetical protein
MLSAIYCRPLPATVVPSGRQLPSRTRTLSVSVAVAKAAAHAAAPAPFMRETVLRDNLTNLLQETEARTRRVAVRILRVCHVSQARMRQAG